MKIESEQKMKINHYVRRIYQAFSSENITEKKLPPFLKRFFTVTGRFLIFLSNLLLIFLKSFILLFIFLWFFVTKLYFIENKYYIFLGEEVSLIILVLGFFALILLFVLFNNLISKFFTVVTNFLEKLRKRIIQSLIWRMPSILVYKISKFLFENFLLPNIDLIEVGLEGQQTNLYPETLIFTNTEMRTKEKISDIRQNYVKFLSFVPLSIMVLGFISVILLEVVLSIVSSFFDFQTLRITEIVFTHLISLLLLLIISSFLIFFLIIYSPSSLINQRTKVLEKEFYRIINEEWRSESIKQTEKNNNIFIDDYSSKLASIQFSLNKELKELNDAKKKLIVTQELIERTQRLVKNNKDEVRIILNENQDVQEEREKKRRWKEKAFDILVVTIGIGLFVSWLSNMLFK